MTNNKDVFILHWRGYDIEVTFLQSFTDGFEDIQGYKMSHVEVRTIRPKRAPLPITDTGYRSIFMPLPEIIRLGGVKTMLIDALNEAADTQAWKDTEAKAKQYDFFD